MLSLIQKPVTLGITLIMLISVGLVSCEQTKEATQEKTPSSNISEVSSSKEESSNISSQETASVTANVSSEVSSEAIASETSIPIELHEDIQVPVETLEKLYPYYDICPIFTDTSKITIFDTVELLTWCEIRGRNGMFNWDEDKYHFHPFTGDVNQIRNEFNITNNTIDVIGSTTLSKLNEFAKEYFGPNIKTFSIEDIKQFGIAKYETVGLEYSKKRINCTILLCLQVENIGAITMLKKHMNRMEKSM